MQWPEPPEWPGADGYLETVLAEPALVAGGSAAVHLPSATPAAGLPSLDGASRCALPHLVPANAPLSERAWEEPAVFTVVHPLSIRSAGLSLAANSDPVNLRRPGLTTYRCSLPGLTGFTASRRAGPGHQHCLPRTVPAAPRPRAGIRPRYSGLRVQGTASSPSSTTVGHVITITSGPVKTNGSRENESLPTAVVESISPNPGL